MQETYDALLEECLDKIFGSTSKFEKDVFITIMSKENMKWLQPHHLRQIVYEKVLKDRLLKK